MRYPSLLARLAAYLVDCVIVFAGFIVTQYIIFIPLRSLLSITDAWFHSGLHTELYTYLTVSIPAWLYFSLMDYSAWHATFGKRLFGLVTVDAVSGGSIRYWQALVHTIVKLVPWELSHLANNLPVPMWYEPNPGFRIGFAIIPVIIVIYLLLAVLTEKKQSLDDLLGRTVVVKRLVKA